MIYASVAQGIEQPSPKGQAAGSNPAEGATVHDGRIIRACMPFSACGRSEPKCEGRQASGGSLTVKPEVPVEHSERERGDVQKAQGSVKDRSGLERGVQLILLAGLNYLAYASVAEREDQKQLLALLTVALGVKGTDLLLMHFRKLENN